MSLNILLKVFTVVVLLVGICTACRVPNQTPQVSTSSTMGMTALDSPEGVASALKQEGATLNLYWPSGGTIANWIGDKLVPGYKAYIKQRYGVEIAVNILAAGGGDRAFFQKLHHEQFARDRHNFDIDVVRVVPSVELLEAGEKGWLLPVLPTYAKLLQNLENVNQPGLQSFVTEGKTYAVPVYQPTISFFYNKERVPNPPQSVRELLAWAKANPRRFTYEDPRSSGGIGSGAMFLLTVMKAFGNSDRSDTYDRGFKFLKELQKYVYPQPTETSQAVDLMKRGDIWLMAFWNDFGLSVARNQKLPFMTNYFPREGTPVRNTPIAIPESAAHKIAGLLFLNYTLSDEVQRQMAQLTQQIPASTSKGVWKNLPVDTFNYDFAYIQSHTFAAFNSKQNLADIKAMVDTFPTSIASNPSSNVDRGPSSKPPQNHPTIKHADAKRMMALGEEQYQSGQLKAALNSFQETLKIQREIGDHRGESVALNAIGLDSYMLGHSNEALKFWQESSAVYSEIGDRVAAGKMLFKIGAVSDSLGQYNRALKFYQQSLAIYRDIGDRSKEKAITHEIDSVSSRVGQYRQPLEFYESIGDALLRSGNLVEAERTLLAGIRDLESVRQGLSDTDKISLFETQTVAYRILQEVLINKGEIAAALEVAERGRTPAFAELLASRLSSKPIAQISPTISQIRQIAREQNATLVEYSICDRSTQSNRSQESQLYIWVVKPTGEVAFRRVNLTLRQQESFLSTEVPHASIVTPIVPDFAVTPTKVGPDTSPENHFEALSAIGAGIIVVVGVGSVVWYGILTRKAVQNTQLQLYCFLLLLLLVTGCSGTIMWFTRDRPKIQNRDGKISIAELVSTTRESIGASHRGLGLVPKGERNQYRLQQLYQILIQPIADLLPTDPKAHVIFIPQSSLFLVPFPALQDASGRYLIEKKTILTAPSIQVLALTHQQRQKNEAHQSPLQSKDLIVGNPTMPSVPPQIGQPPQQLPSLPGAEAEAKAIAASFKTQALTGDRATKQVVLQKMVGARIVHLATHGLLDDTQGLGSAIALAPSKNDNGLLTAEQILDLKLNADLVVLSACDTGRGKITGDGVVGLSRSLISAGVPSVIVSLWSIPDAPTASLMTEFYRNLQQNHDKAQALRDAMLNTMKQHPNPSDWAAFTLIGEAE